MRLLRRLLPVPDPEVPDRRGPAGRHRAATHRVPLRPWQVRHRWFTVRRRGLDPAEVHEFLDRVADELSVAQVAVAALREENARIKATLRRWQSAQAAGHYELAGGR
ncbi:DivIVA domain-containing protein [Micromonospora fluostatini]|uniref:DivIVA domain-containing protein n=1 Tax=Micromonospora sp. JCM 30529 TaxID=3421643 RepID=UPI003D171D74